MSKNGEEVVRLKKALEDKDWALKKTNEAIRILYKELGHKNEELQKLDKLKSDFVSTVSHELRTPLSITKEGIRLVLDGIVGKISEKQMTLLKESTDNIDRLTKIIDDLLDISKIEAGKIELERELVNISTIVRDICSRWKSEFDKRDQNFQVSIPASSINMYIDSNKIIQVLHNLLSNAAKFSLEKGKITVELKEKENEVEISVADTGIGIAKEDLPKVFSKFHQFSRIEGPGVKGTGLGLAICKEIVKMHHGNIKVESRLNKGSRFSFSLPKRDVDVVLKECIDCKIGEAHKIQTSISLIVIYIPEFDGIQQKIGQAESQDILKYIEKAAKDSLRSREDAVMRGTSECMVILFDAGKKDIGAIKQRIEKAINIYLSGCKEIWLKELRFTFGYATYPDDTVDSRELLKKARAIAQM